VEVGEEEGFVGVFLEGEITVGGVDVLVGSWKEMSVFEGRDGIFFWRRDDCLLIVFVFRGVIIVV